MLKDSIYEEVIGIEMPIIIHFVSYILIVIGIFLINLMLVCYISAG